MVLLREDQIIIESVSTTKFENVEVLILVLFRTLGFRSALGYLMKQSLEHDRAYLS